MKYPVGDKGDWSSQAEAIESGKIDIDVSDIPSLLEWLQDMNWPGADLIVKFLIRHRTSLVEPIRNILISGDKVWINWILIAFGREFNSGFWCHLIRELEQIGFERDEENTHIEALSILARYRIVSLDRIRSFVDEVLCGKDVDQEDYFELLHLLNTSLSRDAEGGSDSEEINP